MKLLETITMETNKEQQHTAEPWSLNTHQSEILDDNAEVVYLNIKDFKRACECVNPFKAIKDPEHYLRQLKSDEKDLIKRINEINKLDAQISKLKLNVEELEKYRSACEGINPDNPMAVAQNLKKFYKAVDDLINSGHTKETYEESWEEVSELLTKLQSK